jgi:hypothetical protein
MANAGKDVQREVLIHYGWNVNSVALREKCMDGPQEIKNRFTETSY